MIDYTTRDYEGFRTLILQYISEHIEGYTDFSSSDFGVVLSEAISHALDILSYYNDRTASEIFISTAQEESSMDKLCLQKGYIRPSISSAEFTQKFTKNTESLNTEITIPAYTRVGAQIGQTNIEYYTKETLVIPSGTAEDTVSIVEGVWVSGDIIGQGDGTKWQRCKCSYTDVDNSSLVLQVNDGSSWVTWERVDSFIGSLPTSNHYRLVYESGLTYVEFGSGQAGRKPQVGVGNIIAHYRVSSGSLGNVPVAKITSMLDTLDGIETTVGISQDVIGTDRETIEESRVNATANLRTLDRAVTLQDYADLAAIDEEVQFSNSSAEVRSGVLTVVIYVVPVGTDYLPSQTLKDKLAAYFEGKKELGREVSVENPYKQDITVSCAVQAHTTYKNADIRLLVVDAVEAFFTKGQRLLGEELQPSDLMSEILNITGVRACSVSFDGAYTAIQLEPGVFAGLTTLVEESIVVTGGL